MKERLTRFKNTIAGAVFAVMVFGYAFVLNKDLFDYLVEVLSYLEHLEIDEIFIGVVAVLIGLVIDLAVMKSQKERYIELQEQRVQVLKTTVRTVQDIVNNFLNNLLFFRFEAETGTLSPSSLQTMDSLIQETSAKLTALGELDEVPEKRIADGMTGIDLDRS